MMTCIRADSRAWRMMTWMVGWAAVSSEISMSVPHTKRVGWWRQSCARTKTRMDAPSKRSEQAIQASARAEPVGGVRLRDSMAAIRTWSSRLTNACTRGVDESAFNACATTADSECTPLTQQPG